VSTDVLEDVNTDTKNDDNDEEQFAHYAESASVTEGYIMGTPVIALCGKVFVPFRNPEKLRVCSICKEIVEALFL
jgi:hypothetical protein